MPEPTAVTVLHSLRPHTAVTTPTGTALVLCQVRDQVTVLERGIVRTLDRYQVEPVADVPDAALRGLGREAYRRGAHAHEAVTLAQRALGRDLTGAERGIVMGGWRDERAEVSL